MSFKNPSFWRKFFQNISYKVEKLHENGDCCPYFNRGKAIKIGGIIK